MKKFILAVAALSLVATPALADHRDNRWGVDSNRNSPYYGRHVGYDRFDNRGVSTSGAVAIGVLGLLLGGIIGSRRNEDRYRNPSQVVVEPLPQPGPITVCESAHCIRDQYGNILRDQYGRDIVVPQRCWQQ